MHSSKNEERDRGLDRREFIKGLAVGAAGAAVGCAPEGTSDRSDAAAEAALYRDFELDEATFSNLASRLRTGEESSLSLVRKYLERIEATNLQGPSLHAVIEVNPEAEAIAEALDAERAESGPRSPVHGLPILLKDNIDTADRMTTTAGSLALEGSIARQDSAVAARLRAAGAVLVGKANLSEWANFRSTRSTGGWSGRGGLARNPYALDRNACGSSSGSGVAVSANLCAAAVGTETDGSVVCPSSITGIVGIKPTLGLVAQAGIIPIAHSQDTAGPMARTVTDAALLLGAMAVDDQDFVAELDPGGLAGARIGVTRKFLGRSPDVDQVYEDALLAIADAGATLVEESDLPTHGEWGDDEYQVLLYEFKHDLNQYLRSLSPDIRVRSLADVIAFNSDNAEVSMPFFGQEILELAQEKGPLTERAYLDALASSKRLTRSEGIDAVMDANDLDALVAPTTLPAWVNDLVHGGHRSGGASSAAAVSGYPSITVPSGFVRGLPVGLLFFGRESSDAKLIRYAFAFEQATSVRTKPRFLPTLDL